MALRDRLRIALSPVTHRANQVPVVPPVVTIPTTISAFTANISGLGKAPVHAVRPYLTDIGPRPNGRPHLSGLLIPPRIRRGYPLATGVRVTRAQTKGKV